MSQRPHHYSLRSKSFIRYSVEGIKQELLAWREMIRFEWPLVLLLAAMLLVLLLYANPIPPKQLSIAAGQSETSYNLMAERYAAFFKKHGVQLKIIDTKGAQDNLEKLIEKNEIQSALLLAGTLQKKAYPKVQSLGSVQYVPLWLFYRGPVYEGDDPFAHFTKQKVSVGAPGTGTYRIIKELLTLHSALTEKPQSIVQLSHTEAANALIKGEIDAMVISDGFLSPTVQRLLKTPDIHIYNFSLAPAYVKKMPFLDVVTIPRGALDLEKVIPHSNINMVASSLTLLIEKDLHPALQLLFMMAADEFGDARDQFFARPDEFPAYKDQSIPLSPVARHYLNNGPSVVARFVPYWVASFIDRMWLLLVAILAVLYPLLRMMPNYRQMHSRIQITAAYEYLRQIEVSLARAKDKQDLEAVLNEIADLEIAIGELSIPANSLSLYYSLSSSINLIKNRALAVKQ